MDILSTIKNFLKLSKMSKKHRQEVLTAQKDYYRQRKEYVDEVVKRYSDEEYSKQQKYYTEQQKIIEDYNTICPKCGKRNIITVFRRPKGEISGSFNSQYSHSFVSGYCSTRGSINGSLDTYKVNKCKDCENEFEVKELEYSINGYYRDKINYISSIGGLIDRIASELHDLKDFNPNSFSESCNTIEEKYNEIVEKLKKHWSYESIKNSDLTIETLYYFYISDNFYSGGIFVEDIVDFGGYDVSFDDDYNHDAKRYVGTFKPEILNMLYKFGYKWHMPYYDGK